VAGAYKKQTTHTKYNITLFLIRSNQDITPKEKTEKEPTEEYFVSFFARLSRKAVIPVFAI
jgi:hypothetical protein